MTLPEAIKILSEHNRWRVGEIDAYMHKPSEITQAIDLVLEAVRKDEFKKLQVTYGAIRRMRLLALKLMRSTNACLTTNVSAEYRTASFV